jgi:hypothetical protein
MKQFVALMVVVFLIGSCGRRPQQRVDLADVTRPIILTLTPPAGSTKPINYLTLEIRGRLNGPPSPGALWRAGLAEVSFSDSVTNTVGLRFTIKRTGNYGGTNCIVRYVPRRVTSGRVSIQYAFD